ncbi:hypothetical protein Barb4_00135 [Bacteroidales bacterium Barb4]|nr:hypothetical protein Barb4_00135 [Bacteroidales bacterium Barb4]
MPGIVLITPHSAALHVGLKSLALSGQGYRNDPVQGYPERIQDFSPTCSAAECGVIRTTQAREF